MTSTNYRIGSSAARCARTHPRSRQSSVGSRQQESINDCRLMTRGRGCATIKTSGRKGKSKPCRFLNINASSANLSLKSWFSAHLPKREFTAPIASRMKWSNSFPALTAFPVEATAPRIPCLQVAVRAAPAVAQAANLPEACLCILGIGARNFPEADLQGGNQSRSHPDGRGV